MTSTVRSDDTPAYETADTAPVETPATIEIPRGEEAVLAHARQIMAARLERLTTEPVTTAELAVQAHLDLLVGTHAREVFSVLFLDNRHYLTKYAEMFYGTIDGASVHPREVAKAALMANAAAVIFVHNHPSGGCEPSSADMRITTRLVEALKLLEIRVLDHIIVTGGNGVYSFAQNGLI